MSNVFAPDSPFMDLLNRLLFLLKLNLVTLLFCLPLITAGASFAAMHTLLLSLSRDEESYVFGPFFEAFKKNFRQALPVWLFFLLAGGVVGGGIYLVHAALTGFPLVLRLVQYIAAVILVVIFLYAFPLVSRYDNTFVKTLQNSLVLAVGFFPRTLGMLVVICGAALIMWLIPQGVPLYICFCLTAPGYLCAKLYGPIFKKLEGKESYE